MQTNGQTTDNQIDRQSDIHIKRQTDTVRQKTIYNDRQTAKQTADRQRDICIHR